MRPELRNYKKPEKLSQYPSATCYEAGHLVTVNSGWRNKKPVINLGTCVGCKLCYKYCPEGVIHIKNQSIAVDYDFCKGCGICATLCPKKAISMEVE